MTAHPAAPAALGLQVLDAQTAQRPQQEGQTSEQMVALMLLAGSRVRHAASVRTVLEMQRRSRIQLRWMPQPTGMCLCPGGTRPGGCWCAPWSCCRAARLCCASHDMLGTYIIARIIKILG